MKYYFLFFLVLSSSLVFAGIDDASFKNTDKYSAIKLSQIGLVDSINLKAKFIPPKNKKVNHASSIKIWEKDKDTWTLTSTFIAGNRLSFDYLHIMEEKVPLRFKKSKLAIEAEFIHCDFAGGQCAMEKYLTKVRRNASENNKDLTFDLRIH